MPTGNKRSTHQGLRKMAATAIASLSVLLAASSANSMPILTPPADGHSFIKSPATTFSGEGSGSMNALSGQKMLGKCPLEHTSVNAEVSGYVARVTVTQVFNNPYEKKIEGIYTFPLPDSSAVDQMEMRIGKRVIKGDVKTRETAQQIYSNAKDQGYVAALLDQERPNIFTQSVANIEPGHKIAITLKYVELLPFENGKFGFAFPTVVGPRFEPGIPATKYERGGVQQGTDQVPDASRITPRYAGKGVRAGHDISIRVHVNAGVPIGEVLSASHEVSISQSDPMNATVTLSNKSTIPNRDFVVGWTVGADKMRSGYLTNAKDGRGFVTLMLIPPKRVSSEEAAPKEMIFVVDRSGSQEGAPIEKAKDVLNYVIDHMNPHDTIQIFSFSDKTESCFERPVGANRFTRAKAKSYVNGLSANGGTEMADAVRKACAVPADGHRLRIVTLLTDGYIGNDSDVLALVKELRANSRWFPFGTGDSVNRYLIDEMARAGGGEPEVVLLNDSAEEAGKKFYSRISSPVLTDIKVKFDGLSVSDVIPGAVSDLWAERPLYIKARYDRPGSGTVHLTGFCGAKRYEETLAVTLPANQSNNQALGSVWARSKVAELTAEDYAGSQSGKMRSDLKDKIVRLALEHHLLTPFTSFIAVDTSRTTSGGTASKVAVPLELPSGVPVSTCQVVAGTPPMLQGSFNGPIGAAPTAQGSTNGTIGPEAGDGTIVSGVNTSGTVKMAPTRWWLSPFVDAGGARDANLFPNYDEPLPVNENGQRLATLLFALMITTPAAAIIWLLLKHLRNKKKRDSSAAG
jgi:Ca-activated chloride channel family protein